MELGNKKQWQVRVAVLLIFALGFAAGALSLNIYNTRRQSRWADAPANAGTDRQRFERMLDSLQLTPEQRAQVDRILNDARAQLAELRKQTEPGRQEVRRQTDERLQSVLKPEQWQQFKQARDEIRSRRDRERLDNQ